MSDPRISGIILAAGASRRFGTPKQLLDIDGRPMLRRVIDAALESVLTEVIVVFGCRAAEVRGRVMPEESARLTLVDCIDWAAGASASLKCGVAAIADDSNAAAILLGDQPELKATLVNAVVHAFIGSDRPMARPVFGKHRMPGHPVVIDRTLFPDLLDLQGDAGARELLASRVDDVHEVHFPGDGPRDIDTPQDYARLSHDGS